MSGNEAAADVAERVVVTPAADDRANSYYTSVGWRRCLGRGCGPIKKSRSGDGDSRNQAQRCGS